MFQLVGVNNPAGSGTVRHWPREITLAANAHPACKARTKKNAVRVVIGRTAADQGECAAGSPTWREVCAIERAEKALRRYGVGRRSQPKAHSSNNRSAPHGHDKTPNEFSERITQLDGARMRGGLLDARHMNHLLSDVDDSIFAQLSGRMSAHR